MRNIIDVLEERGFIDTITEEEKVRDSCQKPVKVYCGFDPTQDSLHLGNMIAMMGLAWFQRHGHTPVALVGGATGMVGDPSGKKHERPLLDENAIRKNVEGIRKNLECFLDFNHPTATPIIVNNYDWFKDFQMLDFLRDVGKYFRMGPMLSKESVRARLNSEEGLSFTEFSYQLLQGYDFLYLYKNYGVAAQIGGSDQWGNITAGTDLIRKVTGKEGYGITFPLLTNSDGEKFGKTAKGAVWLSSERLSPYEFYQYFFTIPDVDVCRLLRMLTFLDVRDIEEIETAMGSDEYIPNTAQRRLAEEVTLLVHGQEGLASAQKATEAARPGTETVLDADILNSVAGDVPSIDMAVHDLLEKRVVDVLVNVGLQNSKGEARRLIRNGGFYLNNQKVDNENMALDENSFIDGKMLLLSVGKKKKMLVRIEKAS